MQRLTLLVSAACLLGVTSQARSTPTLDWVAQFNGQFAYSSDLVHDLLTDPLGYIYVTGQSQNASGRYIAATVKYAPDGTEVWSDGYVGPSVGGPEEGMKMALDADGNLYVAGHQGVDGVNFPGPDIFVAKYGPDGTRLWVSSYGWDANGRDWDVVTDLVVDDTGNAYLTGSADNGSASGEDVQTVCFTSSGALAWVRRYDGPGHWNDRGAALTLDGLGNLYVTGKISINTAFNEDYITLKYDLAGNLLWSKTLGSPAQRQDLAQVLVTDAIGNVYVSGAYEITANNRNFGTVKYAPDGTQLWFVQYGTTGGDTVNGLELSNDGNLLLTGMSGAGLSTFGVITLKYTPDGTTIWTRLLSHLEPATFGRRSLAEDASGRIYLLTFEVIGGSDYQWHPVQLDGTNGTLLWETSFGMGTQLEDYPACIAVTSDGSIYANGLSQHDGVQSHWDYTTVRWTQTNPAGVDPGNSTLASVGLRAYPNPATTEVRWAFAVPTSAELHFELLDAEGRRVRSFTEESVAPGPRALVHDLDGLPSGVYWGRLSMDGRIESARLVVTR